MAKKEKKNYTTEFKENAVSMVINSKKPTVQIARDLGVIESTLYSWVNIAKSPDSSSAEINVAELFEENKRLKKELALAKEQRDILKKATAYFASKSK